MKDIKLIKWVAAGRYMSNINKREKKISGLMIIMIIISIATITINNK